jgi:hypothetical protein
LKDIGILDDEYNIIWQDNYKVNIKLERKKRPMRDWKTPDGEAASPFQVLEELPEREKLLWSYYKADLKKKGINANESHLKNWLFKMVELMELDGYKEAAEIAANLRHIGTPEYIKTIILSKKQQNSGNWGDKFSD